MSSGGRRPRSAGLDARMTHLRYTLVVVALLSCLAWLLLEYVPWFSEVSITIGWTGIVILMTLISHKWSALAACSLVMAGLIVGERWRYLLVVAVWASWLGMHLLNYVSKAADWPIALLKACWLALLFLALAAPFSRRWRELAIYCLTLFFAFRAFALTSMVPEPVVLPNLWLQEAGFHLYASHLIRSTPLDQFLSACKLVDYIEEDGLKRQVGECSKRFRSTVWFRILVIYDPSGQLGWPEVQRTSAWKLAVSHLPTGRYLADTEDAVHVVGEFYQFLDWTPAPGDNEK
jgi:hypothetical protein